MKSLTIIIDGPRHPLVNMALDYTLLRTRPRRGEAVLRIYQWLPSGISIGRRQEVDAVVDLSEANKLGYIVVKRPTGGAALIHETYGEITYSLLVPPSSNLYQTSVEESSSMIAEALIEALVSLGIPASPQGFLGMNREENICLLKKGFADIVLDGRKISGSAQYRSKNGLLQHGSIMLHFNPLNWVKLIKTGSSLEEVNSLVGGILDLGYRAGIPDLINSIITSFSNLMGLPAVPASYEPIEIEEAMLLVERGFFRP
ncbi:MAG: lipoate--protein ligase family protein [Desulfurococcales archaeon]|nr:lipoate--protein ligase family protein [Desulfurococcales archaeon]